MPNRPKPIELHQADGTTSQIGRSKTRKKPARPVLPAIVEGRPDGSIPAPRHLTVAEKKAWREISGHLESVLDLADSPMVELAAVALAELRQASADVAKHGQLVSITRSVNGEDSVRREPNPSVKIRRDALTALRPLFSELGIGPAARASMAALGGGKPAVDARDELAEMRKRVAS